MEEHLHGRLTTLNKLRTVRDDGTKSCFVRQQADKAMRRIVDQLHDRKLMRLRERLIKATQAGDYRETWRIENQMREYERDKGSIEIDE